MAVGINYFTACIYSYGGLNMSRNFKMKLVPSSYLIMAPLKPLLNVKIVSPVKLALEYMAVY